MLSHLESTYIDVHKYRTAEARANQAAFSL